MDGILELLALLVRLVGFLFQLLDFLHVLHGIVSFVADLMSRAWASIPWFRRKPEPKIEVSGTNRRRRMATEPSKQV